MKLPLVVVSALTFLPFVSSQASLPTTEAANPRDTGNLNGTYLCEGVRPDGAGYKGTVRILRHNSAYQVLWSVGNEEQYLGIGLLTGNVLAVSYFGGAPGVVAYRIEHGENGARLVGQWTIASAGGRVFGETLTRLTHEVTAPPVPAPRQERLQPSARTKPA